MDATISRVVFYSGIVCLLKLMLHHSRTRDGTFELLFIVAFMALSSKEK